MGRDIRLISIEIVMCDQTTESINETNFNIIVNIHPTDCTHWFLVIRRDSGAAYCFLSFDVETPL